MLVITGAQRSGTSFTANFFRESGFNIGSNFFHKDIDGGLENIDVCLFFREYLGDPAFPFSDMPIPDGRPGRHLSVIDYPVIKFSYLLMNPILVYIWNKFRPPSYGDTFLVLKRNPGDIVQSKARCKRFDTDSLLLNQSAPAIDEHLSMSLYILQQLGYKMEILEFPAFLHDFKSFARKVQNLGLDMDNKFYSQVWNGLVDMDKVHFMGEENGSKK